MQKHFEQISVIVLDGSNCFLFELSPGQVIQQCLQLLAYDSYHAILHSIVGHVNQEDEGWRLRKLVVLLIINM